MRRLLLVLALSLGLAVPQAAVTRPAIASVDDCPRGYVCLFRDRDTQGWEHFQLSARSSYGDLRMAPTSGAAGLAVRALCPTNSVVSSM